MSLDALNVRSQLNSHSASIPITQYGVSPAKCLWRSNSQARELYSKAMGGLARSEEATQLEIYPPVNRLGI